MDEVIAAALRAVRYPGTGAAAAADAVASADGYAAVGVYLVPADGALELLGAGGRTAAAVGRRGPVDGELETFLRRCASLAEAGGCAGDPFPAPWDRHRAVRSATTALGDGAVCVVVAGGDAVDAARLRESVGPLAVLAGLVHARREADRCRRELQEASRARALLAASLEHDLRTPLHAILGSATTLQERGAALPGATREQLLAIIVGQANRAAEMLAGALAERRGSDAPLRPVATAIEPLSRRVADAAVAVREGEVVRDVPDVQLTTDGGRLERALLNLLDNALRYSPAGTSVFLTAEVTHETVTFTVADAGPGVAAEVVPSLFSPFATDPNQAGGTGLGLHSVARIAEELGGGVTYTRRDGWSRFSLTVADLATASTRELVQT